jgi:predicted phospho-2-dehydro-3-deoxyheptonate aldolase
MASNAVRMSRIQRDGRILMVPLDHGISMGPVAGLVDIEATMTAVAPHATCVTVHKGLLPRVAPFADRLGILLHLSASTDGAPDSQDKHLVATVDEAVKAGCDGVSLHVNVGSLTEARQLEEMGRVSTACADYGMPLVAMMYPRGPKIKDPFDPALVAHAARLGMELGADAVKVPFTGQEASFRTVVKGAHIPVLVAGGPKRDDNKVFLADLAKAKKAGAAGVSVGRNVFQAKDVAAAMAAVAKVFE